MKQARSKLYELLTNSGAKKYSLLLTFDQLTTLLEMLDLISRNLDEIENQAADMGDPDTIHAIDKRSELRMLIAYIRGTL